jgi:hypothetical protein
MCIMFAGEQQSNLRAPKLVSPTHLVKSWGSSLPSACSLSSECMLLGQPAWQVVPPVQVVYQLPTSLTRLRHVQYKILGLQLLVLLWWR